MRWQSSSFWLVRNIGTESGGKPALRQALELSARSAVAFARMSPGVPDGQAVVLEVAQLQALLAKTFNVGWTLATARNRSRWCACGSPKR